MTAPCRHPLAHLHQGPLVDRGVLVGAPELLHPIAVDLRQPRQRHLADGGAVLARVDDDLVGGDPGDDARAARHDDGARVLRHLALEPGADDGRLGEEERHRLALHVRAHQRAVGVVVLEERNQRGRDRHQLIGRHVHEVDPFRREQRVVVAAAAEHQRVGEAAVGAEHRVGLRDREPFFLRGRQPADLVGDAALLDHAVRRLDEAEIVDPRERREARDQADVRAFRRLDRAHPAVLRVVHVADFEAGALPGEAARTERREPALVGQLGQRVGLVHELRQLARAEEGLDHGRHGAGVDQVVERDLLRIGVDAHPLLDQPRHPREADRELVGDQLAHRPDPAVAEMVDVVGVAAAVVQVDQVPHDGDEVLFGQDGVVRRRS